MLDNSKVSLVYRKRCFLLRLQAGFNNIMQNKKYACLLLIIMLAVIEMSAYTGNQIFTGVSIFENIACVLYTVILIISILVIMLWVHSTPILAHRVHDAMRRVGLHNGAGETPILIKKVSVSERIFKMDFRCDGIPLNVWNDSISELESAMNITISEINLGQDMRKVQIVASKGKFNYHNELKWQNSYLSEYTGIIRLGECAASPVKVSLDVYPHILIGGGTGSGKTWLLKLILMQCVKRDCDVYIADFKGGVDYALEWRKKCVFIDTIKEVIRVLTDIVSELEYRKRIFAEKGCSNIISYNEHSKRKLQRIIFACDEVAELLDVTGLDKSEKEQIKEVSKMLSTIARLGRAFGIHLILATQRPDADILPGQIKNNISYRICGRADSVLSKIILDNTDAATRIPTDVAGVFMNQDGIVFKGYAINEEASLS